MIPNALAVGLSIDQLPEISPWCRPKDVIFEEEIICPQRGKAKRTQRHGYAGGRFSERLADRQGSSFSSREKAFTHAVVL
jgi:hypothetical protein